MNKYHWSNNTLEKKLRELQARKLQNSRVNRTISKELDLITADIEYLKLYLNDDLAYFNDSAPLLDCYAELKEIYNRIKFLWEHYREFRKISESSTILVPEIKSHSYSKEDILELTHDFYKSLNSFYYHNFMKNYRIRKDHVNFESNEFFKSLQGETVFLRSSKEAFINVERYSNIDDIITLIHEYGHATSFQINPASPHKFHNIFSEIESLFFELLGYDYLTEKLHTAEALILQTSNHNEYVGMADDVCEYLNLISWEEETESYTSNKKLKEIASKKMDMEWFNIEDLLQDQPFFPEIYLTSYMYALELYMLYQKDKDLALHYIKQIIMMRGNSEKQYYYNIKRLGIIPNEHLQEFQENLKRKLIKHNVGITQIDLSKKIKSGK